MTAALSASQAFATVDFGAQRDGHGVFEDCPYDVDALHGDLLDRLAADFKVRTRAEGSNPPGHIVTGLPGAGKTRLLAALRRKVWESGGWFVRLDAGAAPDFWSAAASGFQASLSRRMKSGRSQAGAVLTGLLQRLSQDRAARAAGAGKAKNPVETLLAMLSAFAPAETAKRRDIVRALALTDSRNPEIRAGVAAWMQGRPGDRALLRDLGFTGLAPPPAEIVNGLTWLMSLAGPTLVAVEGLEAEAVQAPGWSAGLAEWHRTKKRAMAVIACRDGALEIPEALRPARPLLALASPDMVERLIAARLAPAYARAGFAPPYPSFPFSRAALQTGVGLTPRELLARCARHQQACQAQGGIVECAALPAPPEVAPPKAPPPLEADPPAAAPLKAAPRAPFVPAPPRLPAPLLAAPQDALASVAAPPARSVPPPRAPAPPPRLPPPLRAAPQLSPAPRAELAAPVVLRVAELAALTPASVPAPAVTAPVAPALKVAELAALAEAPVQAAPPPKVAEAPAPVAEAAAPSPPPPKPRVAELAGLALAPEPEPPPAPVPPPEPEPTPAPLPPPVPSQRELTLGRSAQVGEIVGPIALSPEALARHVAVIADSGRGGLMTRIVEEAALTGLPALVLDLTGELSRLGEPWPSRPTEFTEEDARKAKLFRANVEGVLWTPGLDAGRPLALDPLPDFAGLAQGSVADDMEERARAAEIAVAAVEPYLAGQGPKAIKMRGAFVDAFGAFARKGGGGTEDFLRLLADLPESASRIAEAAALAREIAVQLVAARAVEPLLQGEGEPLDPASFFESPNGRVRISVINLSGLGGEAARAAFLNHLYVALFGWLRRQGERKARLLVLDEAHLFAPLRDGSAAKRSTLALLAQARKYGLALMFGSREPRSLDPAITQGCLTHLYGPISAPEQARSLSGLLVAKGAAGDEADRVRPPEFLFSSESHPRPIRIRTPLTLSRRTLTPPNAAEIAALARQARNKAK